MIDYSHLTTEQRQELLSLIEQRDIVERQAGLIKTLYPEEGKLSRHNYPVHMEFFRAGKDFTERCAMCANRFGKSFGIGGYEMSLHLTGLYPDWWEGYRFDRPIDAWAAGKTTETTRDIVQFELFGGVPGSTNFGTRLLPKDTLGDYSLKPNTGKLIDKIQIKHVSGGYSTLGMKCYEQGRGAFEGTAKDLIWFDEEPSAAVYGEALMRTMTTNGLILLTFTPLEGMSEVVMSFLPKEYQPEDV